MSEKIFSNVEVHEISGRAKLSEELLEELLKHGKDSFNSARVDFEAREVILETFTIICED